MRMNERREALTFLTRGKEASFQELIATWVFGNREHLLLSVERINGAQQMPEEKTFFPKPEGDLGRSHADAPQTAEEKAFLQEIADTWLSCTHQGNILSRVDRINDVPRYLTELGVDHLIPYLLITEKTGAFVFNADLGTKSDVRVVELYQGLQGTEWRVPHAQLALRLDDDLEAGLIDDVAVVDFVVPFAETARIEARRGRFELPRDDD